MQFPVLFVGDLHSKKKLMQELLQLLTVDLPRLGGMYGAKTIVFVGDLLNQVSRLETEVLLALYDAFEMLSEDFDVHILAGNHDALYRDAGSLNVLKIFSGVADVHTSQGVEVSDGYGIEFLPWSRTPMCSSLLNGTTPGMVITHAALRSVVDALRIEKFMGEETVMANSDPARVRIVSGHIHYPYDDETANEYTLGTPYPTRDKDEEYNNRLLLIASPTAKPVSIPLTNAVLYPIEIYDPAQLPPLKEQLQAWFAAQQRPTLLLKITITCFNGSVRARDIAEFKKDTTWIVKLDDRLQQQASTAQQESIVAAHKAATSPLAVYSQYIQAHPSDTHTAKELIDLLTMYGGVR